MKPGRSDFNNALNETADPRNQFAIRSSMDLRNRTELDLTFRWIDSLRFNNGGAPETVPSYGELGARLAWFPTPPWSSRWWRGTCCTIITSNT